MGISEKIAHSDVFHVNIYSETGQRKNLSKPSGKQMLY
jgi:hypothetical protein